MAKSYPFLFLVLSLLPIASMAETQQRMGRQDYVSKYAKWAIDEMNRTGVPASITLAQGILESDCGNSDLAVQANNHFGIKCNNDWTGNTMHKNDDRPDECFRSYESAYQSFVDHSDFLVNKKRYCDLFELDRTDYKGWAKGLKKAGYATERSYADRLIKIIEEEGLDKYDRGGFANGDDAQQAEEQSEPKQLVAQKDDAQRKQPVVRRDPKVRPTFAIDPFPAHTIDYNNGVRYVEVLPDDTFESIAAEFHIMVWELYKYNDLDQNADIRNIDYLYLRPKKSRSHPEVPTHIVSDGDTMWSIAHQYGIMLRKLLRRNDMEVGSEPEADSVIRLR